ncbi:glycoside hydrolase superfamily [Staphylotrichum tortipilum]|uniref:Mannan endo-1,4-beta-mannosidase A n=1 Tax=Staphylotrichum tortipilum TaxID=2831512 RepID=A0AAN6MQ64_9PEZI|nr:glycoside hydrolase superfamily [Staphylotrichum longicolle]
MKSVASILLLAGAAAGQQAAYGQCGGINYSGPTNCVSGYACTSYNPYYYQCVPGTATSAPATTSKTSSTVKTTSTSSSATSSTSSVKTSTSSTKTTSSTAAGPTATGFAKTNGLMFEIDGVTKYFAGTNCYWCGFLTANADVDHVFADMAAAGFKVIRVWGFNDVNSIPGSGTVWYQYLSASGSQINTGANGLQRLDYVVSSAAAHGLKLIINFVNNWNDYGGINAYVNAFGGSASTWYTNTAAQAQYQKYIEAVVSRYKTSTAVFAWELANEPRCSGCDASVIYNWAAKTSQYIKSLDSNHMVTIGDEGFGPLTGGDGSYPYQAGAGGYTWVDNLNISTLDFGTLHLYPDSWGQPYTWGDLWVSTHAAACVKANKPCILEEYGGTNNCTVENPWQKTALSSKGIAGDMFWQYGDTLPSCNCQTSQDGNTVFYNQGNWDCMVTQHVAAINAS